MFARWLVPGGVVFAAAAATVVFIEGGEWLELLTGRYAVVLYAAGALLAGVFHRSRVVAALAAFAWAELLPGGSGRVLDTLVPVVTLLLLLLGVLALLRDRGVWSRWGAIQVGGAAAVGGVAYLVVRDPGRVQAFWDAELLPWPLPFDVGLPQTTLIVAAASMLTTLFGVYRWRGPVERALLWAGMLLIASLLPTVTAPEASFLAMCAGLVLSVSVLETSYFMAYRDELTGLPARRALVRDLEQIGGGRYALAMVDVDHFKDFNDEYGHDVGDQVLKLVATQLVKGSGGGKAYRYGGEEFTLLYPGRDADEARPYAESVRAAVDKATFSLRAWNRPRRKPSGKKTKRKKTPKKLSVTVSIGLADSTAGDSESEAVLKRADEALYKAKRGGRNRVV